MPLDSLFVPEWFTPESTYVLSDAIAAFQIASTENGAARFGSVSNLQRGSRLEACGSGFNERTITVRCRDLLYFVFVQDLDAHCKRYVREGRQSISTP